MRTCLAFALLLAGCSQPAPPNPPPAPPADDPEPADKGEVTVEKVESNKPCASGEARCDAGSCAVDVQNACDAVITCELAVLALCKGETEAGEAKGAARDTIPVGGRVKLEAGGNCEGRVADATQVESLTCR